MSARSILLVERSFGSCSDPKTGGARHSRDPKQKEWVRASAGDVRDVTRELRVALRVESCGSGVERNFCVSARIANQRARHCRDGTWCAIEHGSVDDESLNVEQG